MTSIIGQSAIKGHHFCVESVQSNWGVCSPDDVGKWGPWRPDKCSEECQLRDIRDCLVEPCIGESFRLLGSCSGGDCVEPKFFQWSQWSRCDCSMNQFRNRTCDKTEFYLQCKGHQKENRECFKEDCSDEDILAFLDLKENFQKNMETWRSSLNRHPLDVVFKNGSREYMAEMNLKEKMSLTLKKIRNVLKNPKKRILEMKRLFNGQKPALKYSLIGIICLVIILILVKIVSCCWKAETSKNGYRKLANIDIEN